MVGEGPIKIIDLEKDRFAFDFERPKVVFFVRVICAAEIVEHRDRLDDAGDIERAIAAFARGPNDGLIVTSSTLALVHRDLIIALAASHRLPSVYNVPEFGTGGGLISYGPNTVDKFRRAATYVDRVLKGEKPADLPVQAPTKYELVINLKTAKMLGLTVPPSLLARADEVIE
jgi:ABC-type uncharacterized transport system substrate-binding protein